MPTFTHGSNAKIFANGFDVSSFFSSVSKSASVETAEVTTLGETAKSYIAGLEDGSFSVEGYYDGTTGAIDAQMQDILGSSTVFTMVVGTDAVGAYGYGAQTVGTTYDVGAEIGGAVSISAEGQATAGTDSIRVLNPLSAKTTTGSGTQLDNTASTPNGASCYLHVTSITAGATATVKIQESTDGSTWTDLASFAAVTSISANNGQRVVASGVVDRYLRAYWTISGSSPSVTFHASAARL